MPTIFDTPEPRSVMTYNLKNGWNFDHWERRRDGLVNVILTERPTLLGTQEGFRFQLDYLRDNLPGYDYVGTGRFADETDEYAAIFYDTGVVTVADSGTFWLASTHDVPGSKVEGEDLPRIATWARVTMNGHDREVVMINTHLTYQEIGLAVQTASLGEGIGRIATPEDDVILTGDFNQSRQTATWQSLTSLGFADAVDFAESVEGPAFTYADWKEWDESAATAVAENRIDWILYRPGTGQPLPSNVRLRVINTHTEPNPPSDHFPVILANRP